MNFDIEKPSKVKGFFKTLFLTILLSGCIFAALYFTNIITFKQENNCEIKEDNNEQSEEKIDIFKADDKYGYVLTNHHVISDSTKIRLIRSDDEEIEGIFQKKYDAMFNDLREGDLYLTSITETINYNGSNITGYKVDLSKIVNYYTEDCLNYIKNNYFYSNDKVNYYYLPNAPGFINIKNTIFGGLKRVLKLQLYDDDQVIFKTTTVNTNEYIMYKKVNDTWKVENFN